MGYYVYILRSQLDGTYYKGVSENYSERLDAHNRGESTYTKNKTPWKLIYVEECPDKKTALIREKKLKRCKAAYFEWLSDSDQNIIKKVKE